MSTVITVPNGADLSAARYFIMTLSGGNLILASAATNTYVGVLDENAPDSATSGHQLAVTAMGEAYVSAGAAFPFGAFLISDGNGAAIESAADADVLVGQALETADASGDVVRILVNIGPNR